MTAKIDAGICERLITAATNHCSAAPPIIMQPSAPPISHEPNWEGVTTALTSMSTAISWGLFVLAVIGLLGLIGFVIFVRQWAKEEARKAAQEWFDKEAPAILKELNSPLNQGNGTIPDAPPQQPTQPPQQPVANNIADAAG